VNGNRYCYFFDLPTLTINDHVIMSDRADVGICSVVPFLCLFFFLCRKPLKKRNTKQLPKRTDTADFVLFLNGLSLSER